MKRGKDYLKSRDLRRAVLEFRNATRVVPGDSEGFYQLGMALMEARETREAAVALRRATELNSRHVKAHIRLAEMLSLAGTRKAVEQAHSHALTALASEPANSDALALLAFTELRLGKLGDAEAHARKSVELGPVNLRASVVLAQAQAAQQDENGAIATLKHCIQRLPQSPEPLFHLAVLLSLLGRQSQAEETLVLALKADPNYQPAILSLAYVQERAGRWADADRSLKQLAAGSPSEYGSLYAFFLFRSGRPEAAVAEFERLASVGTDSRARHRLVEAYVAVGRFEQANRLLNEALRSNTADFDDRLQRSVLSMSARLYKEAESDLVEAIRIRPNSAIAHFFLGKAYAAQGADLNSKQELMNALRLKPSLLVARLELAEHMIEKKRFREALELLDHAPSPQDASGLVLSTRVWALISLRQTTEARKLLTQSSMKFSQWPDHALQTAVLSHSEGNYAAAAQVSRSILRNHADTRALDVLVRAYAAQGLSSAGLDIARQEVLRHPGSAALQTHLGIILERYGDPAHAREQFALANAIDSSFLPAQLAVIRLDVIEKKYDIARRQLLPLLAIHKYERDVLLLMAYVEEGEKRYTEASDRYRAIIELNGHDVVALNNLAYLLMEHLNRPIDALKYAEQAKAIAPESATIADTLGWIYVRTGGYTRAIQQLAGRTEGMTAQHLYHASMAYAKTGQRVRAEELLREGLKKDPTLREADMARAVLAGTR